VATTA
jgi:hypothetical protein